MSEKLWSPTVKLGSLTVSRLAFGTEHINQTTPEFGGAILSTAARCHNVFFWDTDNCYGSQSIVAAGLKMQAREKIVVCSKTYAKTEKEAKESFAKILEDLQTPYLDLCLLHGVEYGQLESHFPALHYLQMMKEEGKLREIGLSTHCSSVAWDASDVDGINVLCVTFNRDGSRIDEGSLEGMQKALDKAHNQRHKGTYVIKVLGRGDLVHDLENALRWAASFHDRIDVFNIGMQNLREVRQNLEVLNRYYSELEEKANG